jgi:hypothetical protein
LFAGEVPRDVAALVAFIDSRQRRPHAWGRFANDCLGYALGAVEAQTGIRVAPELAWSSRAEALRLLKRFASLEAAIDTYFVRIAPAQAMRGDIAGVVDAAFGIHPMIVEGSTLVSPGENGNRRAPRKAMRCAWSAVSLKKGS